MQQPSNFTIYNASAGSGKTFTLVKEYLKILLASQDIFKFQQILAITFTNKAANEMKQRVLQNLKAFSEGEKNTLFYELIKDGLIDAETIQKKSEKVLDAILKNYTAFSITTIDSFTHKIVKSFAFDLGLTQNFEVELDTDELLRQSVDVLISKIGSDKDLTKTLIQFAKEKSDEDKSWDITRDLFEFSKLLLKEDDVLSLQKIEHKSLDDFLSLKESLSVQNKQIEKEFEELGNKGLEKMSSLGLEFSDFTSSYYPKLLDKFIKFKISPKRELSFSDTLNKIFNQEKAPYSQKVTSDKKQTIDANFSFFQEIYLEGKSNYSKYRFNRIVLKSIIPLATLRYIHQELKDIKEDNNIQLNSEFNHIISQNIQGQPAPFIFERIGTKYRHYFIDEMQDTSQLQWQNLIPLLHNTLSQEETSLLLVGDGKQSIYRWRGGKAEQFIELGDDKKESHLFSVPKKVEELKSNYRSYSKIIDFNNQFFKFSSKYLTHESYKDLFENRSHQNPTKEKTGGYVSINFLEENKDDDEKELRYAKQVLEIVQNTNEFELHEICVLVRKRKEGVLIADYLTEHGIPIVSSETLLLSNSAKVQFLIHLLKYSIQDSEDAQFQILSFLYDFLEIQESQHNFFVSIFHQQDFWKSLETFSIAFDENHFNELSLYEKMEYAIRVFGLMPKSDAYVQFFLDEILKLQHREFGVQEVLEYWELKKDKLSIVSPEGANAVKIMTIHKSKGLEFPVVIFPTNLEIYSQIEPKAWLNKEFKNFDDFLIPYAKELSALNKDTERVYNKRRKELELDSMNLLYVALTRAEEQLYIVTDAKFTAKEPTSSSVYFKDFLEHQNRFEESVLSYEFGDKKRVSKPEKELNKTHAFQEEYTSVSRENHKIELLASSSKLWGTTQNDAIQYGNLIHEVLAKIYDVEDVEVVLQNEFTNGVLLKEDFKDVKEKLRTVVFHPQLKEYYQKGNKVFNERALTDVDGQILIPDRLVFKNDQVVIIDYKTGIENESHKQQLLKYERLLKTMGYKNVKKILVYLSNTIHVVEF